MKQEHFEIINFLKKNEKFIYEFLELSRENSNSVLTKKIETLIKEAKVEVMSMEENSSIFLPERLNSFMNNLSSFDGIRKMKILFYGLPGTGKTFTVNQIAKKLNVKLKLIKYTDLISKKIGETSKNILYAIENNINENEIIFFDEFDAILSNREENDGTDEYRRVTTILLQLLDKIPETKAIFFSTNFKEKIDPAIFRRFDFDFNFNVYDYKTLMKIYIESLSKSKIFYELKDNSIFGEGFFEKKIPNLFNSKTTPFMITSSIEKTDSYFEKHGELNLFYLFIDYIKFNKNKDVNIDIVEEVMEFLISNNFSINQTYEILRKEFGISNSYVRKFTREIKQNKGDFQ